MTWKRISIVTAVSANAVVLVAPGAMIVLSVMRLAGMATTPSERGEIVVLGVMGFGVLVWGGSNILCVRIAHRARGDKQRMAIKFGLTSCAVLGLIGLVLSAMAGNPIPVFILGAVAYVTAGALCQPRAEPPPEWQCPNCDYDMRGLDGGVCPECGLSKAEREVFANE